MKKEGLDNMAKFFKHQLLSCTEASARPAGTIASRRATWSI
jgi:hypothetical protein